jgi:hypothetical protein
MFITSNERVPWSWAPCLFSRAAPPNNFSRTTTHAQPQSIGCTARRSAAPQHVFGRSATPLRSGCNRSALAAPPPPHRFGCSSAQQPAIIPYYPQPAGVSFTWAAWGERAPRCAEKTALCRADCSRTCDHMQQVMQRHRDTATPCALARTCSPLQRLGQIRQWSERHGMGCRLCHRSAASALRRALKRAKAHHSAAYSQRRSSTRP